MAGPIRKPIIAGSWYPGNPTTLKETIKSYLDQASIPDIPDAPVAIIVPHAGYLYSGQVAAYAYKSIINHDYSTVVVISPSHRAFFPHVSLWARGAYETPLGLCEVDEDLSRKLLSSQIIKDDSKPHAGEHALEIQLPFLQVALDSFKLCPLILGQQDLVTCERLAESLYKHIPHPQDVLVVASSDLSHFHSGPKAEEMDARVAEKIASFDIAGLSKDLESTYAEACGGGPIMTSLLYAKKLSRLQTKILKYAHSGHITGDTSSVVGYLAAVIY
ncbi:MAG: AmmeMemoRadiSam system protein B [Desulfomonilia bacterium]|nr:AmmeMemoRadiSam system protein B [Desulfomonilia bacterium]